MASISHIIIIENAMRRAIHILVLTTTDGPEEYSHADKAEQDHARN